jgi:carbamoyl-phosphate synthase large subunit
VNLLLSCVGKRGGYIADFFRPHLAAGDRIVGTANTPWTPGFRACDAAFVLPDVHDDDYVPAVLDLCERERVDALFCIEDFDLERLLPVRAELEARGVLPVFPPAEVAELALDKYRMCEFLTSKGIATPRTVLRPEEASGFGYPMYVKPRRGSGSQQVFRARDAAELAVFFDYSPDMIVQEEAVGPEINIQLCADFDGTPVGICVLRKRAMRHGETDQAETFRDPAVIEFGLHLGELLGGTGPMDIDVIRQGDELVVLEANTRFGGGYPVSHLAGADFPKLLLDMIRDGGVTEPNFSFADGVVMMKDVRILGGPAEEFFRDALHVRTRHG